jgi:hypothetical protein
MKQNSLVDNVKGEKIKFKSLITIIISVSKISIFANTK